MNSLVMWIAGLFAAVLAALFAVPYFVDWNGYRGVFEEEASRILGRDVRVGGKINVRLLPTPYLRFEKLRIADTRPNAVEPIFKAETFTLWLSVPPLLQGNLEARHLALDQPVVTLSVDDKGTGNWTELGIRPGTLPFMPQKVALQAVDITNGTIVLRHPRAGEVGRLSAIEGEVSAETLSGPFKFAGFASLTGHTREIRLATAKADDDGTLRFKATARPKDGAVETAATAGASYQLDGSLKDFYQRPQIEGALSATVPLPQLPSAPGGDAALDAKKPNAGGANGERAPVYADVKGRLTATADRLDVSDIVASIENVGQPQLLTGATTLEWGQLQRLDFSFSSRWLDLDRLAGREGRASPIGTSVALIEGLTHALSGESAARGVISVDQLTLGGEAMARLELAVSRVSAGKLRIERLQAALPAGGRIALEGLLIDGKGSTDFAGQVTAAGPSMKRLMTWALPGSDYAGASPDLSFTFDSALRVGSDGLLLRNARGDLGGHGVTGSARRGSDGTLAVDLVADEVESDWLWSGGLSRTAVLGWLSAVGKVAGEIAAGPPKAKGASSSGRFDLKLRTGVLRGPDRAVRDVRADVTVAGRDLVINQLAFQGGDGLEFDVTGQIVDPAGSPKGRLAGVIGAGSGKSLEQMLALLDVNDRPRISALAKMTPLRLAGDVALGQRGAAAIDLQGDGAVGSGRLTVRAAIDGGLGSEWRSLPAEITITADDVNSAALFDLVFGQGGAASSIGGAAGKSRAASVAIKAVGVPGEGLVTDAALSHPGLTLSYNGRAVLDQQAMPSLSGTLEVAADRLGDVLALLGAEAGAALDHPVTGTLGLSLDKAGRVKVTPGGLTIAGAEVSGSLAVGRGGGGRLRADGELALNHASVAGLLSGLADAVPQPAAVSAADLAFRQGGGIWTDQAFTAEAFARFEGKVSVGIAHLAIAPDVSLTDAQLRFDLNPGRIDAELASSRALGGQATAQVTLQKAAAGARMSGWLAVDGMKLAALGAASGSKLDSGGLIGGTLQFEGQGLSPRSLVVALKGDGRLKFSGAWIGGLAPKMVADTIAAGFAKEFDIDAATLQSELGKRFAAGRLTFGDKEVALSVADGALNVAHINSAGPDGSVDVVATVDLQTMQAETEWRIVADAEKPGKPAWPPVSIYYTGALGALAAVEPRVALGNFERELTVRRMEHEVEELERLRKLDEERARQERERLKAQEEERKRQKAAELERLRLEELERARALQQQNPPLPLAPAPVPARPPDPQSSVEQGVGGQALAPAASEAGAAVPAGGSRTSDGQLTGVESGTSAATANALPGGAEAAAPENRSAAAPVPRPRRVSPRRPPTAGDTMLKSFNPTLN
ncbi:MAG: AsmA family protein [Hyphomicrobiaceae bacterium]|nr:AsmA family protein [Hyphomicrobiaceae bacterium]